MTPPIDQTLHQFANLLPNWTLLPILTLLPNFWGFHRTMQRVWLANIGRLLLRTPGPVPFGTCICSNVKTMLSWTCLIYGPFEFRTSLGTSIYLWSKLPFGPFLHSAAQFIIEISAILAWRGSIPAVPLYPPTVKEKPLSSSPTEKMSYLAYTGTLDDQSVMSIRSLQLRPVVNWWR